MDTIKVSTLLAILVTQSAAIPVEEILPERYLPPRDFNPHPYESGDFSGTQQGGHRDLTFPARNSAVETDPGVTVLGPEPHPYALLARKRPREGRYQHHREGEPVIYPHPVSVLSQIKKRPVTSHASSEDFTLQNPDVRAYQGILYQPPEPIVDDQRIDSHEQSHFDQRQSHSTPVYAFSYLVKGDRPGDHYSHAQQRSASDTRGQYRVKLPDGRLQVVSYVADDSGYKAVVSYDEGGEAEDVNDGHSPVQVHTPVHRPIHTPIHRPIHPVHNPVHTAYGDITYKQSPQHSYFTPAVPSPPSHIYLHSVSSTPSPPFLLHRPVLEPSSQLHYDSNETPIEYSNYAPPPLQSPRATVASAPQYPEVLSGISLLSPSTPSPLHLHSRFINPVRLNRLLQHNVGTNNK